ncbi:MAG: hypothetical protein M0Z96_10060 [Actinomycetota bacterium]|nr:hypothetical protein [Actinomycetota bacterium]
MVKNLYKETRPFVLASEHTLYTHTIVTCEDLMAIVEGVGGPLMDRRTYGVPVFPRR